MTLMFNEIAPNVISIAIIISAILIYRFIKKSNIISIDGILVSSAAFLGLIISFLNILYSNCYLITLGPLILIISILYLSFRDKLITAEIEFDIVNTKYMKYIDILFWLFVLYLIFEYSRISNYRPINFFIVVSICVTLLGSELVLFKFESTRTISYFLIQIFLVSMILRASGYFISPFPVGSDPWVHFEYINDFLQFHKLYISSYPAADNNDLYLYYPMFHIFIASASLICEMSIKNSAFLVSISLVIGSLFVYLITKKLFNNTNLGLLSILLLNFADYSIQWGIELIAMSLGIIYYSIFMYFYIFQPVQHACHRVYYRLFLIIFTFILIWTHTVSSFICLISILSLYLGSILYQKIYLGNPLLSLRIVKPSFSFNFILIFIIVLITHWSDPTYPFFDGIIRGVDNIISGCGEFLGFQVKTVTNRWETLPMISGFLIYVLLGMVGSFCNLSKKLADDRKFGIIFMFTILYFIFFVFPLMGLKIIVPQRWPAFIYVTYVVFASFGFMKLISLISSWHIRYLFAAFILFVSSFFMITNTLSNMDSPIYGQDVFGKNIWTESEMALFAGIDKIYLGTVIADLQTSGRPLGFYLRMHNNISSYRIMLNGDVDYGHIMSGQNMVIWREMSLYRPVTVDTRPRRFEIYLGNVFKSYLDDYLNCIYDTGGAKSYLVY